MSAISRSLLLPGWGAAGGGSDCAAAAHVVAPGRPRSWLRGGRRGAPSVAEALARVLLHLAALVALALLLRNRWEHYQRARAGGARWHVEQQRAQAWGGGPLLLSRLQTHPPGPGAPAAASGGGGPAAAAVDAAWLPPGWAAKPPALDPLACTPQLLVIGGMKCGTSALFHYLNGTVPRSPKAARNPGAAWRPPRFGDDQVFLNGTPASAEYCSRFFSLPDEQRRFHPAIVGSIVTKEVHFFDQEPEHVRAHADDYFRKFAGVDAARDDPLAGRCSHPAALGLGPSSAPALVRMEATVMYMPSATAAGLVREVLPGVRLVALLREPASRALSSINMVAQRGDFTELHALPRNSSAYAAAWRAVVVRELRKEMAVARACLEAATSEAATAAAAAEAAGSSSAGASGSIGGSSPAYELFAQVDQCMLAGKPRLSERVLDIHLGLYALHLRRWLGQFPPSQLLVWSTKAFKEAPWHHMQSLARWLGLDPAQSRKQGDFLKLHKRTYPAGSLPKGFVQELADFYAPHNEELFELLGRHGYSGVVEQLRRAWPLELAATAEQLEER